MVPTAPDILAAQLSSISEDCRPDAIKVGMLASLENGRIVSNFIRDNALDIPIVVDPVMKASVGGNLSEDADAMADFYMNELCQYATVVTPNLEEIEKFGCNAGDMKESARALLGKLRCKAVVVKGGHSKGDIITDVLATRDNCGDVIFGTVTASRINCNNLHGTGCFFSSLMAAELAKGYDIHDAFLTSSWLMKSIISESRGYSLGESDYGPLNLFNYTTKPIS